MAQIGDTGVPGVRIPRVHPSAERTAVVSLSPCTAAQIVWLLSEHQIQLASWMPRGLRAAASRHLVQAHVQECCTRSCAQARIWVSEHGAALINQATRLA